MAPGRLASLVFVVAWAFLGPPVGASELREAVFHAGVGAGLPIVDGEIGEALSAVIGREIVPGLPLFVGLDLGLLRFAGDYSFQVLPTFYYHFLFPLMPAATPYLGISLGPHIQMGEEAVIQGQALARAGLHWILSEELGLAMESRIGVLDTKFFFSPQVNVLWAL